MCVEQRLVLEVDGLQRLASESDRVRDAWLQERGFRVLRFRNHDVLERTAQVLPAISEALGKASPICPSSTFPPRAGEGSVARGKSCLSPPALMQIRTRNRPRAHAAKHGHLVSLDPPRPPLLLH